MNFLRDESSGCRASGWALTAILIANEIRGAVLAYEIARMTGVF